MYTKFMKLVNALVACLAVVGAAIWHGMAWGMVVRVFAVVALFFGALASTWAAIITPVGTLTAGTGVVNSIADTSALLEFCATNGLNLFIVGLAIAIGWKVYRFFKPAR